MFFNGLFTKKFAVCLILENNQKFKCALGYLRVLYLDKFYGEVFCVTETINRRGKINFWVFLSLKNSRKG